MRKRHLRRGSLTGVARCGKGVIDFALSISTASCGSCLRSVLAEARNDVRVARQTQSAVFVRLRDLGLATEKDLPTR